MIPAFAQNHHIHSQYGIGRRADGMRHFCQKLIFLLIADQFLTFSCCYHTQPPAEAENPDPAENQRTHSCSHTAAVHMHHVPCADFIQFTCKKCRKSPECIFTKRINLFFSLSVPENQHTASPLNQIQHSHRQEDMPDICCSGGY